MSNITIRLTNSADISTGLRVSFALAPETVSTTSAGKETGEVRLLEGKAVLSLGEQKKLNTEAIRKSGGSLIKWLKKNNVEAASLEMGGLLSLGIPPQTALKALVEGILLGDFVFSEHKSERKPEKTISIDLLVDEKQASAEFERALEIARVTSEAVNLSRAWAHQPPNIINPVTLAERTQALAAEVGLKCTVLDDKQLEALGAGAIVAVGKGSNTPSRLIILEHAGTNGADPVVLVGKALTMDTGGYSIKSTEGIVGMKYDKSGGMTVIATLMAAAKLKLASPVIGVIAAAENMISGGAYRPDDILKTLSGKTVEIISTDAEGRLVLADALTYSQQKFKARAMIDIATLTGAVVVALGSIRAGLLSNNDELAEALFQSGERTHERLWRMPLDEEYFEQIKGDDADIKNSGGRKAGTIIGATFLKQFVKDETAWAHLDVAGVMEADRETAYSPKGGIGFGVRLFLDYLQSL
jgi:leucyl aminopeptidase